MAEWNLEELETSLKTELEKFNQENNTMLYIDDELCEYTYNGYDDIGVFIYSNDKDSYKIDLGLWKDLGYLEKNYSASLHINFVEIKKGISLNKLYELFNKMVKITKKHYY